MTFALGQGRYRHPREFFEGRPAKGPMTIGDFADLRAYWQTDPWGPFRDDLRNGSLWQAIFAPHLPKDAQNKDASPLYPYVRAEYELDRDECLAYLRETGVREFHAMQAAQAARDAANQAPNDEPPANG